MMAKAILHILAILVIEFGLIVAYQYADYTLEEWSKYYYIWDKSVGLLLILCILYPMKFFKPFWIVICAFFVLRLLWEIPAMDNYDLANSRFKNYFLIIDLLCIILILIIQIRKWYLLKK